MKTQAKVMAAPVAPAAGLKRINLAGIATKSPAAKTAKAYPVLPDPDGQAAALVEGILDKSEQLEALEGALEIEKGDLIPESAVESIIGELQDLFARHGARAALSAKGGLQADQGLPHGSPHPVFSRAKL